MGGETPRTFLEGFISGLAHPVIGPDHLAFIVAIALAAGALGLGLRVPALFVAASLAGVLLHVVEVGIPLSEALVAGSLVLAGVLLLTGLGVPVAGWLLLAAVAGLLHGYAFGEAVVGADRATVGAYLAGLTIVQMGLAAAIATAGRRLANSTWFKARGLPTAGAVALSIGGLLLVLGG
jgi:urease accessory protein